MKKQALFFCTILLSLHASAQKPNWQNLDLEKDSVFGISTEKAYAEILSHKKKFKPVIVGVIDSGVDTAHEDLRAMIWTNPKDNSYNNQDDDRDGYTDDVHGWNFIGGTHGNIEQENLELVRMVRAGKADPEMIVEFNKEVNRDKQILQQVQGFESVLDALVAKMKKDTPTLADFENYHPQNNAEAGVRNKVISALQQNPDYSAYRNDRLEGYRKHFQDELDYSLNINFNPRPIVGDDTTNASEHFYGNHDVAGPTDFHGTHVSGIIGAVRDNGIGIQGIANHVWIMSIRTVPDGDERDKDVANAILFAADHGARVVNMSFGKSYSPDKKVVDEAVKYAMSKDVLLIQAAGNEGKDIDHEPNYPNRIYGDSSGTAGAWIVVGASGWLNDSTLVASFSNYGKTSVDVFAPGEQIYSSVPGSKYENESGTSMAAPVVTGLAALIREYYPKLTAMQVKQIILQSVVKPVQNIIIHDGDKELQVPLSEICTSGGVVNVYNALRLAAVYK